MKKHFSLFVLLTSVFAFALTGCSAIDGDDATYVSNKVTNGHVLTINLSNYEDIVKSYGSTRSLNARTIYSDSFNFGSTLHFYLFGYASDKSTLTSVQDITSSIAPDASNKTATVTLDVAPKIWNLTIVAYEDEKTLTNAAQPSNTDLADAVLIGRATVDMTKNANKATFTLVSDGLTKNGTLNFAVKAEAGFRDLTGYTVTAGVYSKKDDSVVAFADASTTLADIATDFKKSAGYAFGGAAGTAIAPGTYNFVVKFYYAATKTTYQWSDTLIVTPGKSVTADVTVPDIIDEVPDASPTDFTASYISGSEDYENDYYKVVFDWAEACTNETNFVLELADVTDATIDSTPANNFTSGNTTTYDDTDGSDAKAFFGSQDYVAGYLLANNTTATVRAKLGRKYLARIISKNNAGYCKKADGSDDWTYVEFTAPAGKTLSGTAFDDTIINRYRVKYDLNGGRLVKTVSETTTNYDNFFEEYSSVASYDIIHPYASGSAYTSCTLNEVAWSSWKENGTNGTTVSTYTHRTGKNLNLYATYGSVGAEIKNKADYDFPSNSVTVNYGSDITMTNKKVTINKVASTALVITVTTPVKYDDNSVKLTVSYGNATLNCYDAAVTAPGVGETDYTYVFTLPNYAPQSAKYQFKISALYAPAHGDYSYPITVIVKD